MLAVDDCPLGRDDNGIGREPPPAILHRGLVLCDTRVVHVAVELPEVAPDAREGRRQLIGVEVYEGCLYDRLKGCLIVPASGGLELLCTPFLPLRLDGFGLPFLPLLHACGHESLVLAGLEWATKRLLELPRRLCMRNLRPLQVAQEPCKPSLVSGQHFDSWTVRRHRLRHLTLLAQG